jgi:hypothetical protein
MAARDLLREYTLPQEKREFAEDAWRAVKIPDGTLITFDNTRVFAAGEAGINRKGIVHDAGDMISPERGRGPGMRAGDRRDVFHPNCSFACTSTVGIPPCAPRFRTSNGKQRPAVFARTSSRIRPGGRGTIWDKILRMQAIDRLRFLTRAESSPV